VAVRHLLHLADSVLAQIDQRTLDLNRQREGVQALSAGIERARRSAVLLHRGLTRPEGGTPKIGLPTPGQLAIWEELRQLDVMRGEALLRDQGAARRHPGCEPEGWAVSGYRPDGCFMARRPGGLVLAGWSEGPETVPGLLRTWSNTPDGSLHLEWARQP